MKLLRTDKLIVLESLVQELISENELTAVERRKSVDHQTFLSAAQTEIARRRDRRRVFGTPDLFADPAWDILLELYVADAAERKLSVTAIGLETGVASTTVIRWLTVLETQGLIRRAEDASDKRRNWVYLTNKAKSNMRRYFNNELYFTDQIT